MAMKRAALLMIVLLVAWPVCVVFLAAWQERASGEPGLTAASGQASVAMHTLALASLTLAIALPVGVTVAIVLFRTDMPGVKVWAVAIVLPALLPIDVHATAWLAAIGPQGWATALHLPVELKGLLGAAWVHAMAALPWIVLLAGAALSIVETELEEDCLLDAGPVATVWHVTVRRAAGALAAAAILVTVLTASEMAVTDLLQVRTYAETVYTEFAIAGRIGAATATAVPGLVLMVALLFVAARLIARRVPSAMPSQLAPRLLFRLGKWQPVAMLGCSAVLACTFVLPVASLAWRAGLKFPHRTTQNADQVMPADPSPTLPDEPIRRGPSWSPLTLATNLTRSVRSVGGELVYSLLLAAATASGVVPLGALVVSYARESRPARWVVASVACLLLALPGPVLGIGLSLALNMPTRWWGQQPGVGSHVADTLARLADSSAVLIWLHALRTLPFALAVLWPIQRLIDRATLEAAETDGAGAWARFWYIELPAARFGLVAAALVTAVLSVGELAGSVIVSPPGLQPLSVRIFTLAHFGVESYLAGICLVLLSVASAGALLALQAVRWAWKQAIEVGRPPSPRLS